MKNGWKNLPLKEVCTVFADGDWIETKDQSPSGICLIQTGNVGAGLFKNREGKARFISEQTFRRLKCTEILPGDCLVSRLPDPVGRACLLPNIGERMITAVDCTIVRPKNNILLPKFLNYYACSSKYLSEVEKKCTGATRKRISRKNLGLVPIPIPPLPEQKRIVGILDKAFAEIDRSIANSQSSLTQISKLIASVLEREFQKALQFGSSPVGELADHCLGKMLDRRKNQGTPKMYLRNINVRWFEFDLSDLLEMRFKDDEFDRYSAKKGDVLVCEGGYPGRCAIWTSDEPIYFQKALHRVRFHNPLHAKWFMYFMFYCDQAGLLRRKFTGAGIQHFTGKALKVFEVPIIADDQMKRSLSLIEELFTESSRLIESHGRKIQTHNELKQAFMEEHFSKGAES